MTGDKSYETLDDSGTDAGNTEEIVSFHRRSEFPGVEVRSLANSARAFRCYSTDFEFFAPSSWYGEIWHRRQLARMAPGSLLCSHPGEVFLARRVITPGAGNFLTVDARVLHEYLADHQLSAARLQLAAFTQMSKRLTERLLEVIRVLRPGPGAPEIQSALVEFVNVMVAELLERSGGAAASIESGLRTVGSSSDREVRRGR